MLYDFSILQESPFIDKGNVVDLFGNNMEVWNKLRDTIANINNNATLIV